MGTYFHVNESSLYASADQWGDGAGQIRGAVTNVDDAPTSGFRPNVAGNAASFIANWSSLLTTMAKNADAIATNLQDAATAYQISDFDAQDTFQSWLGDAPR